MISKVKHIENKQKKHTHTKESGSENPRAYIYSRDNPLEIKGNEDTHCAAFPKRACASRDSLPPPRLYIYQIASYTVRFGCTAMAKRIISYIPNF